MGNIQKSIFDGVTETGESTFQHFSLETVNIPVRKHFVNDRGYDILHPTFPSIGTRDIQFCMRPNRLGASIA